MLGLSKMRLCVLFALISVVTSMPQPQERQGPPADQVSMFGGPKGPQAKDTPEDMEMLDEEGMKQLLTDLFISDPNGPRDARQLEGDADESEAADLADVTDEDAEALDNEEPAAAKDDSEAQASEEEVARFNNYIDAIYRRMNAALRAKMMDPMTLNLDDKQQKKSRKSNKPRRLGRREADDEDEDDYDDQTALDEDEDEDEDEEDHDAVLAEDELQERAGKAKNARRKNTGAAARKNKKNKKGKKEDKQEKATKKAEREAAKKEKQDKKMKKQELREKKRAEKKKQKAGAARRQSRSGPAKKNKRKQTNNKNKKSKNTNNKNKKSKNTNNKSKKNHNRGRSGNARNNAKDEKMMGSLSGIATLRREGDVVVKEEENHKVITSEFNVGPLQLEVSKMYGKGQARTVKSAKAITEVMSGTMTLKVKPDGSAHVKKVVFKEPENVDVKGSLSDNKPRNLRYLKNSVNKMRPLAAIRVLKTARYVLKSPNNSAN